MTDIFIIGSYWGSRAENLTEASKKLCITLQKLGEIDEHFSTWYETGMSRKKALEKNVLLTQNTMERLCLEKVKQGEMDENGFSKMGFSFSLWTGHKDEESSSISFSIGGNYKVQSLMNSVVLKIPYKGFSRERLLKLEKVKNLIGAFVDIWEPDYCILTSESLRNEISIGNQIGWVTYRRIIKSVPNRVNNLSHENFKNGHLFVITSSPMYNIEDKNTELLGIKKVIISI